MTNEQLLTIVISILTATLALAGLILAQSRALRRDMARMESWFESRMDRVASRLREAARERSELRNRLGRIEGYLDLLRQYFLGNGRGTAA